MTQVKHTPGPFLAVKGIEGDEMRCGVFTLQGYHIATIENGAPGDFCDTEYANALLFAAAPEVLAALEGLLNALDSCVDLSPERLRCARAAIAKATGEA